MRIKILRVIIYSAVFFLGINLFYIQIIQGQRYYNLSVHNRIRIVPLKERRGRIIDRNGTVLADSRLAFDVTVIPQDIKDKEALFDFLSRSLKVGRLQLLRRFTQRKLTPFAPVVVARDVDKKTAMLIEENKFLFPGLYIQETYNRYYPFGQVGAHILGYVGKVTREHIREVEDYGYTPQSVVGYSGVEDYYDDYLRGKPGGIQIEVDNRGRQVQLLSFREPQSGEDISLTIDQRIQEVAARVLGDRPGSIVMMDLDSSEILAMVSSPAFNPNAFSSSALRSQVSDYYTDELAPLLNRAIQGLYPPGSVFKTIVAMAGLDTGTITPDTVFDCKGYFQLGRRRFHCLHVHGRQDLLEGLYHSCNVYFYNVGDLLGPDLLYKYARMFGLGSKTNIDLPFEEEGFVPSRLWRKMENRGWYRGDTLNLSIGQGDLLVTPIQIVRLMATVAREGRDAQPHLIKNIGTKSIVRFSTIRHIGLSGGVYEKLKQGLRLAVADSTGTARRLDIPGLRVSGKTGTAQSVPGKAEHAWFAGYETDGKIRLAFCVFLEHGDSSYYSVRLGRELLEQLQEEGIL